MSLLLFFNRQKTRKVNLPVLRRICRSAAEACTTGARTGELDRESAGTYEIGVHLVGTPEMTRLNETFLRHSGSTDVITFDYREDAPPGCLCGEIFISMDEAVAQARRFGTEWQSELIRYVVHGLLHLLGYDDVSPELRRKMKREENRLLKGLSRGFILGRLEAGEHAGRTK
jgi:probable rRNA maturation factor